MKKVRLIANMLFYFTRLLAVVYLATAVYASFIILLAINGNPDWLPMRVLDNGSFEIFYPFTNRPFLLGDNSTVFKVTLLLVTWGYGLFLWLLSAVFNAFRQPKIFIPTGVTRLTRFYMSNLFLPLTILIIFVIAGIDISDMVFITCLHAVIGIFAFFMAAIFKQGLLLQEEQDLTF